jgi:hypothetical protein
MFPSTVGSHNVTGLPADPFALQAQLHHEMSNPHQLLSSQQPIPSAIPRQNRESDSDEEVLGRTSGRSTAMMFDRSLVSDRNNLKTLILKAVYEHQIHLQSRKGEAFDQLAIALAQTDEFKLYRIHGRKLQKSFNKIARDIKDAIVREDEPSRWGKEEPEFFVIARKIFDEARRAGIRAFDEKLKSKSERGDGDSDNDGSAKKKKRRDSSFGGGGRDHGGSAMPKFPRLEDAEFAKSIEDYINARFMALQQHQIPIPRLHSAEIEAALMPALERLVGTYNISTLQNLFDQAQITENGRVRLCNATGFAPQDDIKVFLIAYCDLMMSGGEPVTLIRKQFGELQYKDAAQLYGFIDEATRDAMPQLK